jgi:hypothetical protein
MGRDKGKGRTKSVCRRERKMPAEGKWKRKMLE